jgi:hypothetical protein
MASLNKKNNRWLTTAIIIISLMGVVYFGYQAISDSFVKNQENPFEYNIDFFKKSDSALHHYSQWRQINPALDQLYAVAIGLENQLYISGDTRIVELNLQGDLLSTIDCGEPVRALAVDSNGDIFLGMQDHVEIYNRVGLLKAKWDTLGAKAFITSIAIGEQHLFVADAGNRIVWKYNRTGALQARIGDKDETRDIPGFLIPSPYFDVAVDPDGFLWAANTGLHSLENYTVEGSLRSTWGSFSMNMEGFCGCCNPTHFAIMKDGSFVTSEKGIPRVKIFNRIGELVSVVADAGMFTEGTTGVDLAVDGNGLIYVLDPVQKAVRVFKKKDSILSLKKSLPVSVGEN